MKIRENYDLSKIIIPSNFLKTPPSEKKIIEKRKKLEKYPERIYLTIDHKRELLDGYATYLAAASLKIDRLTVRQVGVLDDFNPLNKKTLYVYGKHPNQKVDNEYVWRVPSSKIKTIGKINKGDCLIVSTKFGAAPIIVTKTETKLYSPVVNKVKTVIGRPNKEN